MTRTLEQCLTVGPEREATVLSTLAHGLVGSEILKIAASIRARKAEGEVICDLTVGDFAPSQFRIPAELESNIAEMLAAGQTNYPPSDGVIELRKAVAKLYEQELGLAYPVESVLIAGGSRPVIYSAYAAVVDPGEKVVYPAPSWNNNHYTYLMRAQAAEIVTGADSNFLPTADQLRPHISDARLICICTPLNPTGTVMSRDEVERIATLVVEENERRAAIGGRALFLLWDQVYWTLTFGENLHYTPPQLVPESAAWTIFVDGISKAFAATGLRVGWAVAAPYVITRMRDILGHIGAWAPRPEQLAVAKFLGQKSAVKQYRATMIEGLQQRLDLLYSEFEQMRAEGLPVRAIPPQGAIYLSVQFDLIGRGDITSNEQIRRLLLERAGFAVVAFQAFGLKSEDGWMRLSAGAVSAEEIGAGMRRVRELLKSL